MAGFEERSPKSTVICRRSRVTGNWKPKVTLITGPADQANFRLECGPFNQSRATTGLPKI
jgi:hypothetical protein